LNEIEGIEEAIDVQTISITAYGTSCRLMKMLGINESVKE